MPSFAPYDFVLFDLDGTLYDERQYLMAAYRRIADDLAARYGSDSENVFHFLASGFDAGGRSGLFDRLCSIFDFPAGEIGHMLSLMRSVEVKEKFELFGEMQALIRELLAAGKKLFVVTNGNPEQQQHKIDAIDWQGLDSGIEFILANTIRPKPERAVFDHLVARHGLSAERTVFIGDSDTDRDFALHSGIAFIHVNELLKR